LLIVFVRLDTSIDISESPEVYVPGDDSYLLLKNIEVSSGKRLLEMGCGTGLIALHAAKNGAQVTAADINPHAVECTKRNAARNNLRIEVVQSDLFDKIDGSFDLIAFNPPYLPDEDRSTSWLERSWSGGDEGSEIAARFIRDAWKHLSPGGEIYVILSSVGGVMTVLKAARERYEAEMLEEKHMFFESVYAYRFRQRSSQF
jgi:release factor glutamine methyltransferase